MKRIVLFVCLMAAVAGNVRAAGGEGVTSSVLAKSTASWNGSALPVYPAGTPEVTIIKITIPPGTKLPLHLHPVINAGVLLSGQLTVTTEKNEKLHLNAGDPIVEVVNTWHFGENEGDAPAEIIVFYAGVKDQAISLSK
jgi:quercetin dioxygenase-like cupin family protein